MRSLTHVAFVAIVTLLTAPAATDSSAQLGAARSLQGQSITPVGNNTVLVAGGLDATGVVNEVAIRDQAGATVIAVLHHPRAWHTATLLSNGLVAIIGGIDADGQPIAAVEVIDPTTGAIALMNGPRTARSHHTATLLPSGRVLVAGGATAQSTARDAELWDPSADAVAAIVPMRHPHRDHRAVLQSDGSVLISDSGTNPLLERFDPATQTFSDWLNTPTNRGAPAMQAYPANGAVEVPIDVKIALVFSEPIDLDSSLSSVALHGPGGQVEAQSVVAEGGRLVFLTPGTALEPSRRYTVRVEGVRSGSGRLPTALVVAFTTRESAEPEAPVATASDEEWIPDPSRPLGWRSGRSNSGWQLVPSLQAPFGVTALAGQLLLLNGKPLGGVTLSVAGVTATSDRTGRFLLSQLPEGRHTLLIDGRSASSPGRTFGVFKARVEIKPEQTNVLPYTIWMPRIDRAHAMTIASPTPKDIVLTTPLIPGLEVHIPKGAVIKDHDGRVANELSITPIPLDQPPFPLPTGTDVPVYFTIQPGGGYLEGDALWPVGARVVYPNYNGDRPGRRITFWHYDPADRGWHVYGLGAVSPDGRRIVPDDNVLLYEFAGAMFSNDPAPPPDGPVPEGPTDGDPVDLGTGLFVYEKTDLTVSDVLPINLVRTYRPNDATSRPFGIGATHPYAMFLWSAQQYSEVDLVLPDGGRVHYVRTSPGTGYSDAVFEHTATPTRFYKSRIVWNGSGWDLTLKDGTLYAFGDGKPIQYIRDRDGNTIRYVWSDNLFGGSGNLLKLTAPHGRYIEFTYDTSNRITQATDNIGRTVGYTYDTGGRLWKVTDVAGGITEYTYDSAHRMLTIKDPRGIVFLTNQYDSNGRVSVQTLADSTTYQFAYTLDGSGKVAQVDVTNPRGYVTRTVFNSGRYPTSVTEAYGTSLARTTTITRQTGTNFATRVTDPLNRQTDFAYDTAGNLTSVTRLAGTADAVTTTFTYDPTFHQVTSVTDPLNHSTTFAYDSRGQLTGVTDPLNHTTAFAHTWAGQLQAVTSALNHTTQFGYDAADLVSITDPLGRQTTRFVDAAGRVLTSRNALGHATRYEYDAFNRVTATIDALNGQTSFTYDGNGNLLTLTDARNHTTTYSYDEMDRVETRTDPLSRGETFVYDANGNLQQTTDRKSQVTTYNYDVLDRLTQTTYADTSTTVYTYDVGDRATQIADSVGGTITRTFDLLDRLTNETTPEGSVTYTYDAASRRASMTVQGQSAVGYAYDNADRLTAITQSTATVSFAYDDANRRTSLTLPNGIEMAYAYDAGSQLTGLTYTLGLSTFGTLTYTYDLAGSRSEVGGTWARTNLPAALSSATYDAANQILMFGGTTFTYDANGSLTDDGVRAYSWNARNQLAGLSGGATASFLYDGSGRRRAKTFSGGSTSFLYDGFNAVQELSSGSPVANMLTGLGIDEVFRRNDGSGDSDLLVDALGSSVALSDGAGTVQTSYTFEPFGATTVSGAGSANAVQFTGRENDGTGLYYYRARYYQPQLNRFVSEDPLGLAAGPNVFAYVDNHPTGFVDPYGLKPSLAFGGPPGNGPPGPTPRGPETPRPGRNSGSPPGTGAPPVPPKGEPPPGNDRDRDDDQPRCDEWFRPADHGPTLGRDDSSIPPDGRIGRFLEHYVPAAHAAATRHDRLVQALTNKGIPDLLANIPTMLPTYMDEVANQIRRSTNHPETRRTCH